MMFPECKYVKDHCFTRDRERMDCENCFIFKSWKAGHKCGEAGGGCE